MTARVSLPALLELATEMVSDGVADNASADRFIRWAKGMAGVDVKHDESGVTIRWTAGYLWGRDGEARGATLAQAMDAIERGGR